jgi:hypothetical protein
MTIPASYTAKTFGEYMRDEVLQDTAAVIGWNGTVGEDGGKYKGAINDATLAYRKATKLPSATLETAADIALLRLIGRREVWRKVAEANSGTYSFSDANASYDRKQIYENAMRNYETAEAELRGVLAEAQPDPEPDIQPTQSIRRVVHW